jgi:hypothetical protein
MTLEGPILPTANPEEPSFNLEKNAIRIWFGTLELDLTDAEDRYHGMAGPRDQVAIAVDPAGDVFTAEVGTERENRATFEREGRATWASKPGREPAARTDSAARRAAQNAE